MAAKRSSRRSRRSSRRHGSAKREYEVVENTIPTGMRTTSVYARTLLGAQRKAALLTRSGYSRVVIVHRTAPVSVTEYWTCAVPAGEQHRQTRR